MQLQLTNPQNKVIWRPIPNTSQSLAIDTRANHTLFCGTRGPGKCLPIGIPVPTPKGWVRHGDLVTGDVIYGSTGCKINISAILPRQVRKTYLITFNDGSSIEASDNHLWQLTIDRGLPRNWRVCDTDWIAARKNIGYKVRLPARPIIDYPTTKLTIDPYILGAWVGDGSASIRVRQPNGNRTKARLGYTVDFGSMDIELVNSFIKSDFSVKRVDKSGFFWLTGKEEHKNTLFTLGLFGAKSETKFIPSAILLNDATTRIAFLQGLCDTDGTTRKSTGARISTVSKQLAKDVVSLVNSLGGMARIGEYKPKKHHRQKQVIYNIDFSLKDIVPFRLSRKIVNYKKPTRLGWFCPSVTSVEFIGEKEVSCIKVDAKDSLYIAGNDYIITHNTDTQLMLFRKYVGKGYGRFWRGVIFDREYKNLDDLVAKSKRWFYAFKDGAKFNSSKGEYKWVWPTGEELLFRAVKVSDDYNDYHGQEFPFIGWNELTKYPTSELYDKLTSCNRSSFTPDKDSPIDAHGNVKLLPKIPLIVFATTNPFGTGHVWVKRRFIDPAPYGSLLKKVTTIFNPQTQAFDDITTTQVAIFGSFTENIYLDPIYIAGLYNTADENLRKAWLKGDWNVVSGGAFDDLWKPAKHIIPKFTVPNSWRIDRAFDWGSTHPFSVGWFAESNGEAATLPDGTSFCPPPGTLIQVAEWYGTKEIGTNKGLRLSSGEIAKGIIERERQWIDDGLLYDFAEPGPADNQINQVREVDVETIKDKMADEGVNWIDSDKSPGSRKIGLQLFRDRLKSSLINEGPGIYFTDFCRASIATIPVLPMDDTKIDDIDTTAEDHTWDMTRYRVLASNNRTATKIKVTIGG
jgi:hypothetical protein